MPSEEIPSPVRPKGNYYPMLDGVRALAVATVLVGHFVPIKWAQEIVSYGDIGVVVFFVLSGYLITGILLRLRAQTGLEFSAKIRLFYVRRVLRIFPIYYLTILVLFVVGYLPVCDNIIRLLTYSLNIPGLPLALPLGQASHFWSLHVEEQFYLLWPLIVLLSPSRLLHRLLLLSIAGGLVFKMLGPIVHQSINPFRPLLGCIDSLGLGALLVFYQHKAYYRRRFLPFLITLSRLSLPAFILLTTLRVILDVDPWFGGNLYLGVAMFLALGLSSVTLLQFSTEGKVSGLFGRLLAHPSIRYIGSISYGIYVYHFFTPLVVERLFLHGLPQNLERLVRVLLELGLSIAVAALSFRLVERPMLALKDQFSYEGSIRNQDRGVLR